MKPFKNNVRVLKFKCYGDGGSFYVSDCEKRLVAQTLCKCRNIVNLVLPTIFNSEMAHILARNHSSLTVLDLRHNYEICRETVQILFGNMELVRKNEFLIKAVKKSPSSCAFKDSIKVIDLRYCDEIVKRQVIQIMEEDSRINYNRFPSIAQVLLGE